MTAPTKVCANPACAVEFGPGSRGMRDWAKRKFCGLACAHAAHARPGKQKASRCKADLHDLTDDNVYINSRTGTRRCRACNLAYDAKRTDRSRSGKPKPKAAAPVVETTGTYRPVWRPCGFPLRPGDAGYEEAS